MSPADQSFSTSIIGIEGRWPDAPSWFSYSSFRDASECPRRWALMRATYPAIWDQPGYPERANPAAVVGDVVHRALEHIVKSLVSAGADSTASAAAAPVLRSLGGYSAVVDKALAERTQKLAGNPRIAPGLDSFVRDLRRRVPEMRQRTQAALSRTRLTVRGPASAPDSDQGRSSLGDGSYPEFQIVASALGWAGRADLVTIAGGHVEIVDYKTGEPSTHHADQLQIYALLWARQDQLDSARRFATRLTLSYPTHDEDVPVPSEEELVALEASLVARSAQLRDQLAMERPARPAPAACRFCAVRHMCDAYWQTVSVVGDGWTDAEFRVTSRNGPRSFLGLLQNSNEPVLIRTSEEEHWPAGSRWRLLDAHATRIEDESVALSLTRSTEAYRVRD